MKAGLFLQLFINGLSVGMLYVLLVVGLDMILKGTKILNFGHGQIYMLGSYGFYIAYAVLHFNLLLAFFISGIFTLGLGVISYIAVFSPIQKRFTTGAPLSYRLLMSAMASVGLMLILQQGTLLVFGTKEIGILSVFPKMLDIGFGRISAERLMVILISLILCFLLYLYFFKTKLGKAMRAVSFDSEMCSLLGVNTFWVYLSSFSIGCALSGIAGAIVAPIFSVNPDMGHGIIATALMVMMVGGVGSYKGAVVGGIVVGLVLSFGYHFFGGISQPILFVFVMLLLIARPGGLFGEIHT